MGGGDCWGSGEVEGIFEGLGNEKECIGWPGLK